MGPECVTNKILQEDVMDFIERLFGVSPDGGDGSTELIYLAAIVIIVAALAYARHRATKGREYSHKKLPQAGCHSPRLRVVVWRADHSVRQKILW
jgi:hypothetical protein